jgi:hypothetical protein
MQITPGASSLQTLKAQQAWEARRAAKAQAPAIEQQAPADIPATPTRGKGTSQPVLENLSIDQSTAPLAAHSPQWSRKVQDIQNVAAKAGFMGISEQDIRRAYVQGDSLLADYRV